MTKIKSTSNCRRKITKNLEEKSKNSSRERSHRNEKKPIKTIEKYSESTESIDAFIKELSHEELIGLAHDWQLLARPEQLPPRGHWLTWLILGGRGAGKTRAGSEWIHDSVTYGSLMRESSSPLIKYGRIALIAETLGDAREVMVDGQSGILNIARSNRPIFEVSRRRLVWPNGAIAQIFSSEDPESLRGPQFDAAWCDELCKWHYAQETWDMLQFGLRLGERPRQLVTTTPRPIKLLKDIIQDKLTVTTRMRTDENKENLAASFLHKVTSRYAHTRLGRQELEGEIILDREDTLWQRDQIEAVRITDMPELKRIVVAVDPPVTAKAQDSCCGIVVAGLNDKGLGIVLSDGSIERAKPAQWAARVVRLFHDFKADIVVAEVNQGGDMVRSVLQASDAALPIQMVRASRGKWLRAEPVAALYEQGKVAHLGAFPKLEDQMCNFSINGTNDKSPDRLDALVWALTALLLNTSSAPVIRSI